MADQAETNGEISDLTRLKEELAVERAKKALTYAVRAPVASGYSLTATD
jgi:hypothetical protein